MDTVRRLRLISKILHRLLDLYAGNECLLYSGDLDDLRIAVSELAGVVYNDVLESIERETEESHIDVALWTHHVRAATCPHFAEEDSESSRLTAGAELYPSLSCSRDSAACGLDGSPPLSRITTMDYTYNEEEGSTETQTPDTDTGTFVDFEEEPFNETLRFLRSNSRNLVLDSTCPELAPHIVISPSDHDWVHVVVGRNNDIPPQSHEYLSVPFIEYGNALQLYNDHTCCSEFNMVAKTSGEHLEMSDPATSLDKRLYMANLAARPSGSESEWTDPATPLLTQATKYRGTLIIDSPNPSVTPHIIINEPPVLEYDELVKAHNAPPKPQDCASGTRLTVPLLNFENWEFVPKPVADGCHTNLTEIAKMDPDNMPLTHATASPSASSSPTPLLLTPIQEEDEPVPGVVYSSHPASYFLIPVQESISCMEGDEDGLPPLDEWYLEIATRTGVRLESNS